MLNDENINPPYHEMANLIRESRDARQLSQRALSSLLGMSGAYTAHLESGKIQPSVETLRRISKALRLPYGTLALLAGYIDTDIYDKPLGTTHLARLTDIGDLSDEEWEAVLDFARYIRSKRENESS